MAIRTYIDLPPAEQRRPVRLPSVHPRPSIGEKIGLLSEGRSPESEDEIELWKVVEVRHYPWAEPPEIRVIVKR